MLVKLNNGSQVLASKDAGDGHHTVLAKSSMKEEFVTWKVDPHGDAYAGEYFTTLPSAIKNYNTRR